MSAIMVLTMALCFALSVSVAVSIGLSAVLGIQVNNANMRVSFANSGRDIDTSYQNMLAKRNLGVPEQTSFMPTRGGIVDNSSSMLSTGIATSVLNAAGAAYSANKQWGTPPDGEG